MFPTESRTRIRRVRARFNGTRVRLLPARGNIKYGIPRKSSRRIILGIRKLLVFLARRLARRLRSASGDCPACNLVGAARSGIYNSNQSNRYVRSAPAERPILRRSEGGNRSLGCDSCRLAGEYYGRSRSIGRHPLSLLATMW